jgi:SAM-dependent methyltransferase
MRNSSAYGLVKKILRSDRRKILGFARDRALSLWRSTLETCLSNRTRRRIRKQFPESTFVGPYEEHGFWNGIYTEQWLWKYRHLINGVVLDMSTPRYVDEWIYHLPTVEKVLISDLDKTEVTNLGHTSKVDIIGDFCAPELLVPEESFDTVLCISILEHAEDPFALVRNIRRLLRPNGVAFFLCPFAYIDGHMGHYGPDYWRFGRDAYLLMARKTDLEVLEIGQMCDMGKYFFFEYGWSAAATSWHRGVPTMNWMICRRPA